ncbi:hypothetical protein [Telluria aromaticivorans]|uniref:DUF998 domain-containing protein n=1 Tax=Telluria aromaticivorans TaxID=2725995 RepID=A0A7Y2P2E7_9BURK|nr:hypothetical protein [Telluria aromaticivorans]NNG25541.1 hypothetical protein [Telluria aromaticivorans]
MDRKNAVELQEHMLGTYYGLRVGLAVVGIMLPIVVLFAGVILHHVWLEPSISQYYHTKGRLSYFTTRDLFVGGLFAAGTCLYLYKGFSNKENVALNLAGVFALFVALIPTAAVSSDRGLVSVLHGTSAVIFFFCIAYVSLFRSHDTLPLLPSAKRARYARGYRCTGLAMIASPLAAVALSLVLEPGSQFKTLIFWLETFAVWSFAAYWTIKTFEMRETRAEKRGLDAELKREVSPSAPSEIDASHLDGVPSVIVKSLSPKFTDVEAVVPAVSSGEQ